MPADSVTRTPPKPGASDLELAHPVTNDSEAGRALGRAAAGTSGHAQQRARSAAAMQHASRCPEPGRTDAASKLTCRVTGPRTTGTRKDGSASGPRERFVHSSRKPIARQSARRCIYSLELGCNPVVPFSDLHEALAGPAGGTRSHGLSEKNFSVWRASTVFFCIPEANKQLYGPIDMTKREQIVYFQLRMNLFFFFRSLRVQFALRVGRPMSCVNSI